MKCPIFRWKTSLIDKFLAIQLANGFHVVVKLFSIIKIDDWWHKMRQEQKSYTWGTAKSVSIIVNMESIDICFIYKRSKVMSIVMLIMDDNQSKCTYKSAYCIIWKFYRFGMLLVWKKYMRWQTFITGSERWLWTLKELVFFYFCCV